MNGHSLDQESLQSLGEEEVVRRLITGLPNAESVLVGPGDDCAVVDAGGEQLLLLKTDAVVSGVHFLKHTDPERVGWKAAGRVMSDFGAMGGRAGELVVTIALPAEYPMQWVEGLYRGLSRCAKQYGASIVGGETVGLTKGSAALISVAGTGYIQRGAVVTRSGGSAGEELWVTGKLGGSFESERHLDFLPRIKEGQWLAQYAGVTAMMDVSDGLQRDLPRLAMASQCGFTLDESSLPRNEHSSTQEALSDGEDMELLFSAKSGLWVGEFAKAFPDVELTCIGEFTDGDLQDLGESGWQHFRKEDL